MTAKPARILAVDDEVEFTQALRQVLKKQDYEVHSCCNGQEAVHLLKRHPFDLIFLDLNMPVMDGIETMKYIRSMQNTTPVVVLTADDRVDSIVEVMKLGAHDYFTKPVSWEKLNSCLNDVLPSQSVSKMCGLGEEGAVFSKGIVGKSLQMQRVFESAARIVDTHTPLLISGERGSGKELLARAIHFAGPRRAKPFVPIHCSAFSKDELEQELFGEAGRFREADGGTLYLDEVAQLPKTIQVRVLRMIQESRCQTREKVNSTRLNIRFMSGTDSDLHDAMGKGAFREDLYYMVATYPITIPPLRQRRGDIPLLADFFMQQFNAENNREVRKILPRAMKRLMDYHWPGNVEELRSTLERAFLGPSSGVLDVKHLPGNIASAESNGVRGLDLDQACQPVLLASRIKPLKEIEKEVLVHALKLTKYNMSSAASELGIGRTTLYRKLQEYRIELRR